MPKIKTHSGAKKRFRVTASGKIKRKRAGLRHQHVLMKTTKNKRRLRQGAYADKTNEDNIREMIPYK